ncbi:30S ribosomal protein S16 [Candidatus Peregrinibacteria bacterium CG10_big_fil_rev_8_21_14_0_10_49_10]|nr:MAG: 30S ribosomal protein S16 [Candidatus Peregrinibacteria bacterium CG10_big_fil_rev_8_21_14_0_10_49_10]
MLVIRLQRTGARNAPTYRLVVAEHSKPVKGRFKEIVGHYLPTREPAQLNFDEERIRHWMSKGALPSNTVARLLSKNGVAGLEKYIESYAKQKPKNPEEVPEAPAAAPEAPAAQTEEAPAQEKAPVAEEQKSEPVAEEPAAENAAPEVPAEETKAEPAKEEPQDAAPAAPEAAQSEEEKASGDTDDNEKKE